MWKIKKIADICDIRRGASPRPIQDFLDKKGMPWVKIADATSSNSRYIESTNQFIKEEGISKSVIVHPGTLILSNSATPGLPKIMKISACVHDGWLILSNFRDTTRDFIYYKLLDIRKDIINQANGSVFQNLKTDIVRNFDITLPPIEYQNKLVKFFTQIDDAIYNCNKINHNLWLYIILYVCDKDAGTILFIYVFIDYEQINHNLEEQAKAIYKKMFMDNTPKNSPQSRLEDIAEITMGQSPHGSSFNEKEQGRIFFQGRAEFGQRFPKVRLYTTEPSRIAKANDILISVRAPVGDINIAYKDCCIGRGLASIRAKNGCQSFMLYTMLSLKRKLDIFNAEGTVFGAINKQALNTLPVFVPIEEKIRTFERIVTRMDEIILNNYTEICKLEKIRDALLPKLMSGEIDVSAVEIGR